MIFLCGIPSEPSLGLVIDRLEARGAPTIVFNQRTFASWEIEFQLHDGAVSGRLCAPHEVYMLEDISAVYTRLMNYQVLPEVETLSVDAPERRRCADLHATLMLWYELAAGRVLNRMQHLGSNYSKSLQSSYLLSRGFHSPETLITNDPHEVLRFRERHGRIIYKSISATRSIVKLLAAEDLDRLDAIRACPVQFQQYIEGTNIRVHVVGTQVLPTAIQASTVDYRYAAEEGESEKLQPTSLPDDLSQRCIQVTKELGLGFSGIDLKVGPDGQVYCLEVNPSPAFSYYELHTGQPIAQAVADYLLGETDD